MFTYALNSKFKYDNKKQTSFKKHWLIQAKLLFLWHKDSWTPWKLISTTEQQLKR